MSTKTAGSRWKMILARRATAFALAGMLACGVPARASNKVKLHGYITARVDGKTVQILDDRLETTPAR